MKLKLLLTTLIIIGFANTSFSQTSEIDSLKNLLETENNKDSLAWLYLEIGQKYFSVSEFDTAYSYFQNSYRAYSSLKNEKGISDIYLQYGLIYEYRGSYDSAFFFYDKAIELKNRIDDKLGLARTYTNVGVAYYYKGEFEKAIPYYEKSIEIKKLINDTLGQASALNNLGLAYMAQNKYFMATQNFINAEKIYNNYPVSQGKLHTLVNLGIVFFEQKQYEKSIEYYRKGEVIAEELLDTFVLATIKLNLGTTYIETENYSEAVKEIQTALNIAYKKKFYDFFIANIHQNLALVQIKTNDLDQALKNAEIAENLYKAQDNLEELCRTQNHIAEIHILQNKQSKAEAVLNQIIENSEKVSNKKIIARTYNLLSILYEKKTNFEKAHYYQKKYKNLSDSLTEQQNSRQLQEVLTQFHTAETQKENQKLTLEKELKERENQKLKSQKTLLGVSGLFSVLLVFVIFLYIVKNQNNRHNNLLINEIDEQNNIISKNLHDGMSGYIYSIRNSILQKDKNTNLFRTELTIIKRLEAEMRFLIKQLSTPYYINKNFSLSEELSELADFYKKTSNFDIETHIAPEIDKQNIKYQHKLQVYKIAQELLANIKKHSQATDVTFQTIKDKKNLLISVEDNGIGFNSEKLQLGNGLKNLHKRVEGLNGKLKIDSQTGRGTFITLTLPVLN